MCKSLKRRAQTRRKRYLSSCSLPCFIHNKILHMKERESLKKKLFVKSLNIKNSCVWKILYQKFSTLIITIYSTKLLCSIAAFLHFIAEKSFLETFHNRVWLRLKWWNKYSNQLEGFLFHKANNLTRIINNVIR